MKKLILTLISLIFLLTSCSNYDINGNPIDPLSAISGNLTVTGIKGNNGEQGIQGIQGEQGEQGIQGIQGIQGENGTGTGNLRYLGEYNHITGYIVNDVVWCGSTANYYVCYENTWMHQPGTGAYWRLLSNFSIESIIGLSDILSDKQNVLISGTNIKTINSESILGSGNINIEGGSSSGNFTYLKLPDNISANLTSYQYSGLSFTFEQNATYIIELALSGNSTIWSTGINLAWELIGSHSGDSTNTIYGNNIFTSITGNANPQMGLFTGNATSICPTSSYTNPYVIEGKTVFNSGVNSYGTIRLLFASEVSGSFVTLRSGSIIEINRIN